MTPVENFIHNENIKNFRKRLEAPTDDAQREMLVRLLAEEEATPSQAAHTMASNGKLELP